MARRVLITGGSGFVGQWLCRALLARGDMVFAGTIDPSLPMPVLTTAERESVCWLTLDVSDEGQVKAAVTQAAPDDVVHLAGIAFPPDANADPARTFEINALGAVRLLDALEASKTPVRVLVVGSAEQYGAHPESEQPLREDAEQKPLSVYAASKAAQELFALQAARSGAGKMIVICTRSFNHSGHGHSEAYLLPSLVRRAREMSRTGKGAALSMGNTAPVRDYLHVADVVDAYVLLLERGQTETVYNVSSGRGISVRDLAMRVLARLGIDGEIVTDPALVRAADIPVLVGDNTKLRQTTGWSPRRTTDDIIDDLIHAASR